MRFVFYRNTKDRVEHEREADLIDDMDATKEVIDYEDFVQDLEGLDEIAALLGYGEHLPLRDDWSVSFAESTYGGLPCRIMGHTECDFIFLRDKDVGMLHAAFAPDMTPLEWQRHTGFGNGGVDPR
jgi:hypothetical protein